MIDTINNAGKLYSKKGLNRKWIDRALAKIDPVELKDIGETFWRPVFTELETEDKEISSYENNPLEQDFDLVYQGFDRLLEDNLTVEDINGEFEDLAREVAADQEYELMEILGDEVKWAAMSNNLNHEPEIVLVPREFRKVGRAVADQYWNSNPDFQSYGEFAPEVELGTVDEEEILAQTTEEVAGAYMFVSGNTADKQGLEYEPIPGFTSRLGVFEKNQYKNSEENPF